MTARLAIGIDPGPTPGIVALYLSDQHIVGWDIVQCSASALYAVVTALDPGREAVIGVETFVTRGRATVDQAITRDQVATLTAMYGGRFGPRTARQVKAWATDARLAAAGGSGGLLEACKGMRHARDAARHALFAAVAANAIPDPLSRKAS